MPLPVIEANQHELHHTLEDGLFGNPGYVWGTSRKPCEALSFEIVRVHCTVATCKKHSFINRAAAGISISATSSPYKRPM